MASRKKTTNGTTKTRKKPERMGDVFLATLFDHVEFVALARQSLERATDALQSEQEKEEKLSGVEEALSLQVVGSARRLDRAVLDARAILKGTTFSGKVIDTFKARLDQTERASQVGWSLVEDRF